MEAGMKKISVRINTRVPFFLWRMTERKATFLGDKVVTEKIIPGEDGAESTVETYTNEVVKTPWWVIALVRYLPILLILLTADWGIDLWNGVGMFFAAAYMLWYLWMSGNKPTHFYPVSIAALLVLLGTGFLSGTLLYANHILSDIVYLFLAKMLYDDYTSRAYERYYSVVGKTGMFVYVDPAVQQTEHDKNIIRWALVGIAAVSLVIIVANAAIMFKEYQRQKAIEQQMLLNEQKAAERRKSAKAELIIEKKSEENLTAEQARLRQQLGIEVD